MAPTLHSTMLRAALRPVVWIATGALGFALTSLVVVHVTGTEARTAGTTSSPAQHDPAAERMHRLISGNDCWTGEAPAGSGIPSSAVVTLPGRPTELVEADVGFDIWLAGAPGRVHAFCP